jgi:5-methylthioadenosine/S-adenosylhomocysteine deaminase
MKAVAKLSQAKKAPVFMHNSETLLEVEGCIERHGTTPTVLFEQLGLFEHGGGGFHCVHMSDEDIEVLKRKNLWAVTNPASNLKLASGIAPLVKMNKAGVNLAIGTDGAASNNSLNMFREIYLAGVLQKYLENDAAAMPAETVLKMATNGSARAMGLSECSSLSEGRQADIIIIDLRRPNMQPVNNILKNIVYSGQVSNVKLTMIAGNVVYENGEFLIGENPEKIYEKANALCEKLKEG